MYGLMFILGLFLCLALVSVPAYSRFITIRYQSEYFILAVVIEAGITLLLFDF